ncbi:serine protease inhibitor 3/4 isoform X3 [Xylocopa sonorina]|uniref:serine protease inhibitor 3/4 isoform X3 n=1 Tax=Xylocopa sonorina TaxID=1818115 RepID=UPI00403B0770
MTDENSCKSLWNKFLDRVNFRVTTTSSQIKSACPPKKKKGVDEYKAKVEEKGKDSVKSSEEPPYVAPSQICPPIKPCCYIKMQDPCRPCCCETKPKIPPCPPTHESQESREPMCGCDLCRRHPGNEKCCDKNRAFRVLETLLVAIFALTTMTTAENNTAALRAVSEGTNQFSSSFFQTVAEENSGNLIMSPLSADVVLAMAAYGARGETENQFKKVLHLPSPNDLGKSGYQTLIDNLNSVQENKLLLANKIFIAKHFSVKPTYKDITQTYFRSAAQTVDFSKSQEAANIINSWVQQNTNNLIKDIFSPADLDTMTALVLVNAVYFKGQWKNKFNSEDTKSMPFHIDNNTVKNVPTMHRQGTYQYGELPDLNARFIVIPYKGDELSMVIILPNKIDGLTEVEKKLQTVNLSNILNQGYEREVNLFLPKFKVESKIVLNSVLQKMGLVDAFTGDANFSGISDNGLTVSKVVQKAFIEVNEEGSEAAAATEFEIAYFAYPSVEEFRVNGPFFYTIMARNGSIILFNGRVIDLKTTA